jgi:hypothetical protein
MRPLSPGLAAESRDSDDRAVTTKRSGALIVCLVAALAFPALAYGLRRTYFGPAAGGANNAGVEISARLKNGAPTKVKKLEWHNVIGTCSGRSTSATTGEIPSPISVKDGKFSATEHLNAGRLTVTVSGRFKHHNERMSGHLRVHGAVAGCSAIDTGTVAWSAKQPAGQK